MDHSTMLKFARTFPSLAAELDRSHVTPDDLDDWLSMQLTGDGGAGRKAAATFLLHMAGVDLSIDLVRVWGAMDEAHRDAAIAMLRAG